MTDEEYLQTLNDPVAGPYLKELAMRQNSSPMITYCTLYDSTEHLFEISDKDELVNTYHGKMPSMRDLLLYMKEHDKAF